MQQLQHLSRTLSHVSCQQCAQTQGINQAVVARKFATEEVITIHERTAGTHSVPTFVQFQIACPAEQMLHMSACTVADEMWA